MVIVENKKMIPATNYVKHHCEWFLSFESFAKLVEVKITDQLTNKNLEIALLETGVDGTYMMSSQLFCQ